MHYFQGSLEHRLGEQRLNTFRELRKLFSGSWGDQCIIFRDQGITDPPRGGGGGPQRNSADFKHQVVGYETSWTAVTDSNLCRVVHRHCIGEVVVFVQ